MEGLILYGLIFSLAWMGLWFLLFLCNKNPAYIDIAWTLSVGLLSLLYYFLTDSPPLIASIYLLIIIIWMIRLSVHITIRLKRIKQDSRYLNLEKTWGKYIQFKYFLLYLFEGAFSVLLTLPLLFALNYQNDITTIQWLIINGLSFSLLFESISDFQLNNFGLWHKGQVCNVGLWRYSRHPNYFFEWLFWLFGGLLSLSFGGKGVIGLLSPVGMFIMIYYISGIPANEKESILSKGQLYTDYQKKTSKFFPWLPKED